MFFHGADLLLELIAASYTSELNANQEISMRVLRMENETHSNIEDIVRLPLKLPFPSLLLKPSISGHTKHTVRISGPDGNVRYPP